MTSSQARHRDSHRYEEAHSATMWPMQLQLMNAAFSLDTVTIAVEPYVHENDVRFVALGELHGLIC
jgi:hypothetical protein